MAEGCEPCVHMSYALSSFHAHVTQVSPSIKVRATRVNDAALAPNTFVWKLAATKPVTSIRINVKLGTSPCAGGATTVEGSFWPLGRSVFNCNFGFGSPTPVNIVPNAARCASGTTLWKAKPI